ncbi:MAG: proprotein convertase P-domain-containing protein [Proteobacteria bacterium]|nr:proprotein convertase P-domain-containing protein [Pseudomonadota bacterium]
MSRILLAVLALAACSPESANLDTVDEAGARVDESTPEAFGILALLNSASTTESVLDHDAELDARAARSLIAHRNGPDGVFGTADDDAFDDLAEVDAQYYVGSSAMHKLARFAANAGFVPGGSDVVGTWEGVSFTMDEVTATLELANDGSEAELDIDVGLNSRAVQGIFDARPIGDMNELADAYYVGASAMGALKAYVAVPVLAGPWEMCDTSADCAEGLVCMGEIAYGSGIYCVDDTMYDDFTHDESEEIPDNGETLTTSVNVQGLATVPVDVVLTLDIVHPRPSDLVVTIDNFNGYSQVVWDHEENPSSEVVIRAFPSDDMVNGVYNLHVTDTVTGEQGELRGWNLYIVSNWD